MNARQVAIRRAAYAALVAADGSPDKMWSATADDPGRRIALIDAILLLLDSSQRAPFQSLLIQAIAVTETSGDVRRAALHALPLMGPDHARENFGILAAFLSDGRELTTASQAIMQIPRADWDPTVAGPVAEAILKWAKTIPVASRTEQDYVETIQVGMEMAALLPPVTNTRIRKDLLNLGVHVFAIKSVREQMRYDTTRIVVEAGKPFEIIFENVDMMPHNMVVVQPGAREEIGLQAEKMPPQPDPQGRMYVPRNDKILAATRLLEPGQKATLKLNAPGIPGEYEYVCTYPEHWKVMFGQLIVVQDMDAFLQASANLPPPHPPHEPVKHASHH